MSATMSMPMLARGRHRNPRRGACFMELASYLAGEAWSDAPACTDESLAHLARLVNDLTSDPGRPRLAALIPAVIGMRDLGRGLEDEIALIAAIHALPVASESRQRALAVGVGRMVGEFGHYRTPAQPDLVARARATLRAYPTLHHWARSFAERMAPRDRRDSAAVAITEIAARGIAEACVPDPDERLHALLTEAIVHSRSLAGLTEDAPALEPHQWRPLVRTS